MFYNTLLLLLLLYLQKSSGFLSFVTVVEVISTVCDFTRRSKFYTGHGVMVGN